MPHIRFSLLLIASLLTLTAGAAQDTQAVPVSEGSKLIDEMCEAAWKEHGLKPSGTTTDEEFLRRIYLDLAGTIPTADEAREFLDGKAADKRAKLIDKLLDSPKYGEHWAEIWSKILDNDEPKNNFAIIGEYFREWLIEQFNKNVPWDKLTQTILTATGRTDENPATYYLLQGVITNRKEQAQQIGAMTAPDLLGINIACARCHDHPFAKWKQKDFYQWSAFFARTAIKIVQRPDKGQIPIVELSDRRTGELRIPKGKGEEEDEGDAMDMPAPPSDGTKPKKPVKDRSIEGEVASPMWLGGAEKIADGNRRDAFARLMTADPQFAKSVVNRYWTSMFGRGIVHPADGWDDKNLASMPRLLDLLAADLAKNGFDVKWLIRSIANSKTYQRTSRTGDIKTVDDLYFSHGRLRPMFPHQLLNALTTISNLGDGPGDGERPKRPKKPDNKDGIQDPPKPDDPKKPEMPAQDGRMLMKRRMMKGLEDAFDADPGDLSTYKISMQQALTLMNAEKLQQGVNLVVMKMMRETRSPDERIETLFLTFLSRRPTRDELGAFKKYTADDRRGETYADVAWTLLNTSEFFFVH